MAWLGLSHLKSMTCVNCWLIFGGQKAKNFTQEKLFRPFLARFSFVHQSAKTGGLWLNIQLSWLSGVFRKVE
jgi:hypothetical protein